ncbi:MAG: RNB domain-containing ribonuclease [Myxococcales bacterium]|nr:RNB domain-containing ribonuclease [Myxococcales bacterium]
MEQRRRGRIRVNPRGFGFLEVEDGPVAFVAPPDLNPFLDGDVVSGVVSEGSDGRSSARELRLEVRHRDTLFGQVVFHGKKPFMQVDRQVSNTDWPLVDVPKALMKEGAWLVGRIEADAVRPSRGVEAEDEGLERVRARYGIRPEHPDPGAVPEVVWEGRRDLTDLVTITIDAPSSRDLDDALAVLPAQPDGGLRVFVSIADVDALVPAGSALDEDARARGTSVYLAGAVTPMLPRALSEDRLSLLEGKDRPAMTCELRLDPDGEVTAVDLYPSRIRSTARLDYDGVAAFMDRGEAAGMSPEVQDTLRWLRTAAARIAVTRRARGGVRMSREEAYLSLDATGREINDIQARTETSAHVLVERLMVAANEAVARWLNERGLPALYRVHEAPDAERVSALLESARNLGFEPGFGGALTPRGLAAFEAQYRGTHQEAAAEQVVARVLGPARYTVQPGLHFGLGAPLYLHFTSPIRRYADLAVHRVVKRHLAGDRGQVALDAGMEALAVHLNEAARQATKAEAERQRMLAARLFLRRVGERRRGHVVAVKSFGLVVQLEGTGVSGTVAQEALPGGPYQVDLKRQLMVGRGRSIGLGAPLEVEVLGAQEALGRIDLGVVERA